MEYLNNLALHYKPLIDGANALLPFVLAAFGAYIALAQYRVSQKQLKNDLFDRRFAVFSASKEFILHVITNTRSISPAEKSKFLTATRGSQFIFNAEIKTYIDTIWKHATTIEILHDPSDPSKYAREQHEAMSWLGEEMNNIDKAFSSFLSLKH